MESTDTHPSSAASNSTLKLPLENRVSHEELNRQSVEFARAILKKCRTDQKAEKSIELANRCFSQKVAKIFPAIPTKNITVKIKNDKGVTEKLQVTTQDKSKPAVEAEVKLNGWVTDWIGEEMLYCNQFTGTQRYEALVRVLERLTDGTTRF